MKLFITVVTIMVLLSACMNNPRSRQEEAALYDNYVKQNKLEELKRVTSFNYSGWQSLDNEHLIISSGANKRYYITLKTNCIDLRYAIKIGVHHTGHTLDARFDYIVPANFPRQKCFIKSIHQVTREQANELGKLGDTKE